MTKTGHPEKPCVWNGIEYPSKNAAARAIGVSPSLFRYYYHDRGYRSDDEIQNDWQNYVIYDDKQNKYYRTVKEASRRTGIAPRNIRGHLRGKRQKQRFFRVLKINSPYKGR